MTQKRLNGTDVRSPLQEMSGETVAKGVRRYALFDARLFCRALNGFIDDGRIHVMPSGVAASWVSRQVA